MAKRTLKRACRRWGVSLLLFIASPSMLVAMPTGADTLVAPLPASSKSILRQIDDRLDFLGQEIPIDDGYIKVKFGGEFLHRFEYRFNFNFDNSTYEDDPFNLFRERLSMEIKTPLVRLFAQGQDTKSIASQSVNKGPYFENRFDLHQLYAEVPSPWDAVPVSVTVGRQTLSYGDERFVSAYNLSSVARAFDAVKTVYTPVEWFRADAWFSQVVKIDRGQPDAADHSDNFYGLYTTLGPWRKQLLDSFLFIRHNKNNEIAGERPGEFGQLKEYTAGNRFKGVLGNVDYGIEWATQFGTRAHDPIRAWAWHNETGYTFAKTPWTPHAGFEYSYGSGDRNPTDGKHGTFDDLYGATYLHYGFTDRISLRNIHDIKLTSSVKPHPKLELLCHYHWLFLDTNKSPWYIGIGFPGRDVSPNASKNLGQELDLLAVWNVMEHLNITLGYSHIRAGPYFNDSGAHDNANYFFVQTMAHF